MFQKVNIDTWLRKDAYNFFKNYDDPFFNITAPIKVTQGLKFCKSRGDSFFLHALHAALVAANKITEFRMRLSDPELILYDVIHGGSTILNDDTSFSFCYFDFTEDREGFIATGIKRIADTKQKKGLDPKTNQLDMIHFSSIPWVSFTSFKHAKRRSKEDSIPKIVFGKYYESQNEWYLPLSVEVHHAILDGYHMGLYFKEIETIINKMS